MPTNTQHITPSELKDMLPQKPERMNTVPEPKRHELIQITYGIIGCLQEVHNQLGPGLPEYIYQEALATELAANGFTAHKELQFHPTFRGKPMDAYLKMDLYGTPSVNRTKCLRWGERDHPSTPYQNEILVHVSRIDHAKCKALTQLTEREHYQTFGYLRATGWPVALLVNFGTSPKARIERYYNDHGTICVF